MNAPSTWFPTFRRWMQISPSGVKVGITDQGLLQLIATASLHRKRLSPLLAAFGRDTTGYRRRQLMQLSQYLDDGHTLADSLERVPRVLSEPAVLAVRVGTECGVLPQVLRLHCDKDAPALRDCHQRLKESMSYLSLLCVVLMAMGWFLMEKVLPTMHQINRDFVGSFLPTFPSELAVDFIRRYAWFFMGGLLFFIWIASGVRWGRHLRWRLVGFFIPGLVTLRSAEVLRYMSLLVDAGRPLAAGISCLAKYHYDPGIRNKLLFLRNEMELGGDLWRTMQSLGFITPTEASLLVTGEQVGNMPWVAERIAVTKRDRSLRHLSYLVSLLQPLCVLLASVFVLVLALSVFSHLSGWILLLA